jgi:cytochrome P450
LSVHRPPGPRRMLFLRRHPETFLALAREYGDVVYFRIGAREVYFVSDPRHAEAMFRGYYAHFTKDWGPVRGASAFKNGLLTSEGSDHRLQRQKLSAMFARAEVEARKPVVAAIIGEWSRGLRDGQRIDLFQEMSRLSTDIASRVLFGFVIQSARLIDATMPLRRGFRRFMFPYADRLRRRIDRGTKLHGLVEEIRERGRTDPATADALLAPMVRGEAHASIGGDDQLATFLLAGQETIRVVTSVTWRYLSENREAREKLAAEARRDQLPPGRSYAEAVLLESMRLYPPNWMIGRRVVEPYPLDGYTIPKGALVLVSPYVVQRDPRWYDRPERFEPERWLRPGPELPPREAYFPFGAGPRRCIGEAFSMVIGTMMLSLISRDWVFDCDGRAADNDVRLTMQPLAVPAVVRAVRAPAREPAAIPASR